MESFFFGVDLERYRDRLLASGLHRVDVSGGIVYLDTPQAVTSRVPLHDRDRMVMILFVRRGRMAIIGENIHEAIDAGEIGLFSSNRQQWRIDIEQGEGFLLFVADFFLKRYLDGDPLGTLDQLYAQIERGGTLRLLSRDPLDALSLYLIDKITHRSSNEPMGSLRGEHRVVELMLHRFGRLDFLPENIDEDALLIASSAKAILEDEFIHPPTIDILARRCATNATKLKKIFKAVYQIPPYGFVQRLRMEEANLLLRQERLSIGEVARRVGYRHQGHFSRLFYETYGIYPKTLK